MNRIDSEHTFTPMDDAGLSAGVGEPGERASAYDQFRYPGRFYPQASPERMATLGTLFGLKPPPIARCRVLELGCGEGGHLVPLAYVLPDSSFLGVDASQIPVARARDLAGRIDAKNIEFRTLEFENFPSDAGLFDYIISHGVYSWVPAAAQQALLAICQRHLAPNGLAYISYNAHPGGHLRQIPRDLALFHTRHTVELAPKVREAHQILDFVLSGMPQTSIQRDLLAGVVRGYKASDALTVFDLLSEVNEPCYFLDFMESAVAHGLQFVAESDVRFMRTSHLPQNIRRWLDALPDRLLREQYLDFINWRAFRATILCRIGPRVDLEVTADRMRRLMVASSLAPDVPIANLNSEEEIDFRGIYGQVVRSKEPLLKAVFLELQAVFPRALGYAELRERVCRRLGRPDTDDTAFEGTLVRLLVSALANGVVEFFVYQAPYTTMISERPIASMIARIQAQSPGPVSCMYLASFMLEDPILRGLLLLSDGAHDHRQLRSKLATQLDRTDGDSITAETVERSLRKLASFGMLIG